MSDHTAHPRSDDLTWIKSSYSSGEGGQCLEVAAWRKSSYSGDEGGACVEVASSTPDLAAIRDSKRPHAAMLRFHPEAWTNLLGVLSTAP